MKKTIFIICLFCLSFLQIHAQDNLKVQIKDALAAKADVIIDGKKYDHEIFDLLDQSKIEAVFIFKGQEALKKYNAPNGAIMVFTKKSREQRMAMKDDKADIEPMVILNGKVSNKASIQSLSPDDIESIEVVKGEKAREKYNAPNGAILIKTKN